MRKRSSLLLVALAYLGFISLGLPDGLLGVAWPSIRAYFSLPLNALGALLVMFTAGYLLSGFYSGRLLERINVGTLLALSCLATAASMLGYAASANWYVMVTLGLLAGLGAGAIDSGLNTYAATHFNTRTVNWLHACYGIGATLGPVIMTGVLNSGRPWQLGYAIVGVGQMILVVCFGLTLKWWNNGNASREEAAPAVRASNTDTLRLPAARLSIAVFFIYTGIEAAAGAWAYSLFTEARAISPSTAGMWVSVYWGGLTAGRIVSGMVVGFTSADRILRFCMIGIAVGAAMIWINFSPLFGFLGLAMIGFLSAPIFPSLIAATPKRLGSAHTANGIGFQISAAVLGQSLMPSAIGFLADKFGLEIVGPALLAAAVIMFALFETLTACSPKATVNYSS